MGEGNEQLSAKVLAANDVVEEEAVDRNSWKLTGLDIFRELRKILAPESLNPEILRVEI